MRPIKCECGDTYRQSEKGRHNIICSFEKIKCPLHCDTLVERYVALYIAYLLCEAVANFSFWRRIPIKNGQNKLLILHASTLWL